MRSQRSNSANRFYVQKSNAKPTHLLFTRKQSPFFLRSSRPFASVEHKSKITASRSCKNSHMQVCQHAASTDLLRNLLPTHGHPSKKLKLQMASLTQISDMIKTDWLEMQKTLTKNGQTIKILTTERDHWNHEYQEEFKLRQQQVKDMQESKTVMKQQYQSTISNLNQEISNLQISHQFQKQKMKQNFQMRLSIYDSTLKEYQLFKYQVRQKNSDYERAIERLKGEMQANFITFEESKKNLKEIYDKIMNDKLTEQAEGYDLMLKIKQDEKISLMMQMSQVQEENRRRTALKQLEIKKLTDIKTSLQQEVGGLKDQLWSKHLCIDKQKAQAQVLQKTIQALNNKNQELIKTIQRKNQELQQQRLNLAQKIRKKNAEIQLIKKEGNKALAELFLEKQNLQKELTQTNAQKKHLTSALSKVQAQFNSKMTKIKEQWQIQAENYKKELVKAKDELQEEKKALRRNKLLIQEQKLEHQQSVRQLKSIFKKKGDQMIAKFQLQISTAKAQSNQSFEAMKRKLELQIKEVQIAANEQLRLTMVDCNRKLAQQSQQFSKQIQVIKQQVSTFQSLLAKAEQQIQSQQIESQRIKYQHLKELEKVHQENELEKQKLNEQMDKQMREFQRSLQEKQVELSLIKADMQNQIKMLKQANAIETIEQRFQSQISKLKEEFSDRFKQMQLNFKDKYQKLQSEGNQKVRKLISEHQQTVKKLTVQHNDNLTYIAQKTKNSFSFLNQQLLNGQNNFDLQNANPQQKREHIIAKINSLKASLIQKDSKISKLQQGLLEVEKNIEKRVKARKDELEYEKQMAIKNYQKKISQVTSDCANKIQEIEKDRSQHTKIMYSQFLGLKQRHEKQIQSLNEKYKNLERLFQQRPSRAEDLTKIKQLINLQTKMDIQIQSYQKRMETANQIVKYLHLQLSNYKDTYDIFGPGGQNKQVGIVGQGIKQKEASSNQSLQQSQNLIDVIKARKHQRFYSQGKLEDKRPLKEPPTLLKFLNSPTIKQLKIFEGDQDNQSFNMSSIQKRTSKQAKYSNLFTNDKFKLLNEKIKTEKSQRGDKGDNESQIIINAQNFIRLIKNKKEQNPVIKEQDQNFTKKSYRKRKLGKKHPTVGTDHYF